MFPSAAKSIIQRNLLRKKKNTKHKENAEDVEIVEAVDLNTCEVHSFLALSTDTETKTLEFTFLNNYYYY